MFYHIKREFVEFDKFDSYEKVAISLRKLSGRLENESKVSFFSAILSGLLFKLSKDNRIDKEKAEEVLGKEFADDFQKRKEILQSDHSFDNFEKKCYIAN